MRQPGHDVARGDQHAGRAKPALQRVLGVKGGAQLLHHRVIVEAFNGAHLCAFATHGELNAGARWRTIEFDGACAAHAVLASQMSAGKAGMLAQKVGKVSARLDGGFNTLPVDGEVHIFHASACATARFNATACI